MFVKCMPLLYSSVFSTLLFLLQIAFALFYCCTRESMNMVTTITRCTLFELVSHTTPWIHTKNLILNEVLGLWCESSCIPLWREVTCNLTDRMYKVCLDEQEVERGSERDCCSKINNPARLLYNPVSAQVMPFKETRETRLNQVAENNRHKVHRKALSKREITESSLAIQEVCC